MPLGLIILRTDFFGMRGTRQKEIEDAWLSMIAQIESFGDDKTVLDYLRHYWISENGLASAMRSMWGGATSRKETAPADASRVRCQ